MKLDMWGRAVLGAAVIVPLLGSPVQAQTNGFLLQCGSARSAGKACLNRGQEGVPSSLFRDPAGIVQFERAAMEVDVAVIVPSLSFTNGANADARGSRHAYPVPTVAYVGPRLGERLAWGLGLEGIGGMGADFHLDHGLLGTGLEYGSMFGALKVGPVVAYELMDRWSVGASVSYAYGMITDFRMPFSLPAAAAAGMAGLAQLDPAHYPGLFGGLTELSVYGDSEGFAGSGVGADIGVSYRGEAFTVSASFSPKMTLEMDGATVGMDMTEQFGALFGALVQERMANHGEDAATAQMSVAGLLTAAGLDLGLEPVATYEGTTEMSTPLTVGIGASVTPAPGWSVGLEAEFRQWSEAMRTMPFGMVGGDNPNINLLVNGDPHDGAFTYPFPLAWEDAWAFKVGVERWLGGNAFRLGYIYGQNPVPANTVFAAFPAISTQAVSAGTTVRFGRVPLDVSGTYWFENEITGTSPHMISSEYAASDVRLGGFGINVSFIHAF